MTDKLKYVGHTYPIHDAPQKVRGELVYASDIKMTNMLYAKLLLSPVAHGIVKSIDTSKAEKLPGVVKIFTCFNTPEKKYNRYRMTPEQELCIEDERLFTDKARFIGDRIAAVVADSLDTAQKAISLIDVEYEKLPPLTTPEASLNEDNVKIHSLQNNLAHEYNLTLGEKGNERAETVIVETESETPRGHHAAIEAHSCLAAYDSLGKMSIWTATQGVFGVRTVVADLLGLKYNDVRVIKVPMGGSFGSRQEFIFEPVTAYMAKEVKRPVKLVLNREESILATTVRPATSSKIKTKFTKDGKLLEFSVDTIFDAGAYLTSSADNSHAMSKKVTRLYKVPYYEHHCRVAYTNTPVAGGARGWGAPEILTPVEIHMDIAAKALNMDPVELRLKNLVNPYDIDPATELSLGNARIIECLEKGAIQFNWKERYAKSAGSGRYRRGIGVACAGHKNGMYGGFPEHSTMTMKMNEDGSFTLNAGLHEVGCGTITSIKLIAAEVLDVDPSRISLLEADTENSPYDFGSYGSRVTYVCGACAYETAEKLKQMILECASVILQKPKQYLKAEKGYVWVIDEGRKISYEKIATTAKIRDNKAIIITHTYYATSNPGAYAVDFAEVEVDTKTGMVRVTDFLAVQDIGKAINPGMVEGQIQGAVQMGIGYALSEEVKVSSDGRVISNSFKNYHVINSTDMPEVKVLLVEQGGDDGPFGAKSVGEIANVPPAAAVVNAINNALGTSLAKLPVTPEKILAALNNNKKN